MPQNGMNYEGRGKETCCNTCKTCDWATRPGLLNGAIDHNSYPAATSDSNNKLGSMMNGDINHGKKDRNRKTTSQRTVGKKGSTISVASTTEAGRVSSAIIPGVISVNGATSSDSAALTFNSVLTSQVPSQHAAAKGQKRWKKSARKKRWASYSTNVSVQILHSCPVTYTCN